MGRFNFIVDAYSEPVDDLVQDCSISSATAMNPDSKVHGANMGPTWALSAPGGPQVGPMKLAIRGIQQSCSKPSKFPIKVNKQRVFDAWASRVKCPARFVSHLHEICIYIWVAYSLCFFCCLFITVTWWYAWCIEWASGNQEEVQACLVTLWLFIISCYSLYKTTLGLLCSWYENNPHFHKYSMDFHV